MARTRFQNLTPEKKEEILSAAAEEFAQRGYEAASVNRIAEAAGISKGTLYYYFEDKADLFGTVLEEAEALAMDVFGDFRLEDLTREDYWETLRRLGLAFVELARRSDWRIRMGWFYMTRPQLPTEHPALVRLRSQEQELLRALVQRGQELGVVRTDLPLDLLAAVAEAAGAAEDRWILEHWEEFEDGEIRELSEAGLDLWKDMLDARNEGWEG